MWRESDMTLDARVPTAWRATQKSIFVIIVITRSRKTREFDPTIWALRFASKHRVGKFPAASGCPTDDYIHRVGDISLSGQVLDG
jgi:hypothetical protein